MSFYGFEHRYGANMRDSDGDLIGKLVIFKTRKARDAWVNGGNPYITQPGYRTEIKSKYAARFQKVCANVEFAE
jgi:hypothetical protein